jgi:hypothetical protein
MTARIHAARFVASVDAFWFVFSVLVGTAYVYAGGAT